jgi:hypothetical protein
MYIILVKTVQAVQILAMGKHTGRPTMVNLTKYLKQLPFERLIDKWDKQEGLKCKT